MRRSRAAAAWSTMLVALACGAAPAPLNEPEPADETDEDQPAAPVARRRADVADDCAVVPGKPPPKPLVREYTGVAAKARCQREVYSIMGGITHFLGVKCAYCHEEPDYPKMTHRKHVANWMARELIPSLSKRGGGEIWCNDCHVVKGKGTAKILGTPRDQRWAVEWMTTHMVDEFDRSTGGPLRCKDCHRGNLGSPEFQRKIILSDRLPPKPVPSEPPVRAAEPPPSASDAGAPGADDAGPAPRAP